MKKDTWTNYIGNIKEGRQHLGEEMPVGIYRLFEFTMKEALSVRYGVDEANMTFQLAGELAGIRFANEMLNLEAEMGDFISEVQKVMKDLKMGLFRLEQMDEQAKSLTIALSEDLDCSGLPVQGDSVCNYDEGFLRGVLKAYTGDSYRVEEIDCWAKGGRVCRFKATIE